MKIFLEGKNMVKKLKKSGIASGRSHDMHSLNLNVGKGEQFFQLKIDPSCLKLISCDSSQDGKTATYFYKDDGQIPGHPSVSVIDHVSFNGGFFQKGTMGQCHTCKPVFNHDFEIHYREGAEKCAREQYILFKINSQGLKFAEDAPLHELIEQAVNNPEAVVKIEGVLTPIIG
jgi:hypothetical protein